MHTDKLKIYIPAILLACIGFVIAYQFVDPAPPSTLTFSAGQKGGAYYAYAERYRDYLKQQGITVTVLESAGSLENIHRLRQHKADIAFVQSGLLQSGEHSLQSLGSMYFEPLWVFTRQGLKLNFLNALQGKRIAIGMQGSGTQALTIKLLQDNGINENNATLLPLNASQSAEALMNNQVDVAFIVSAANSQVIQTLQQQKNIHLMNMTRAEAYTRRMNSLSSIKLPQGALNLQLNVPATDIQMLASTATLIASGNLHPALQGLVMQASASIHSQAGLFSNADTFPSAYGSGISISATAQHFYKSGPPFLQRFLPFWAANMVDRLKVMLLPFLALLLPLFKIMPPLYRWRIRSRIYRWYEELGKVDSALSDGFQESLLDDLNRIETEIKKVHVPLSYAEELYDLRLHLTLVRNQVEDKKT
ncbi:MAG: TAXI family TRAP transporter solute-binding subunit [Mariprofundaceae bacterium]|nr:TAXI family TRAP transporter solute-binding subunit [Mariprofundaceae bacterium]